MSPQRSVTASPNSDLGGALWRATRIRYPRHPTAAGDIVRKIERLTVMAIFITGMSASASARTYIFSANCPDERFALQANTGSSRLQRESVRQLLANEYSWCQIRDYDTRIDAGLRVEGKKIEEHIEREGITCQIFGGVHDVAKEIPPIGDLVELPFVPASKIFNCKD